MTALEGFHVNSDKPREEYLIPLQLSWTPGVVQPTRVTYPSAQDVQVGPDLLSVFTGTFEITTEFAIPATAPVGATTVTGKLHYQACNNRMCFRPMTTEVHLPVVIE